MKQDMTLDILIQLATVWRNISVLNARLPYTTSHGISRIRSSISKTARSPAEHKATPRPNVVLEALHTPPEELKDQIGYLTRSSDGKALKSSSIYIRDRSGNLRYIFSVNYDISSLKAVDELIRGLITTHPATDQSGKAEQKKQESAPRIPHTVTELLDSLIEHALAEVGKPVVMMTKEDKIRVVRYLNDAGAFLITKSGDRIASVLGISKFTLYKYMESGTP